MTSVVFSIFDDNTTICVCFEWVMGSKIKGSGGVNTSWGDKLQNNISGDEI